MLYEVITQNGSDPGHEPMIVLLADGNNDFNKSSGRTQSESDKELDGAVAEAKAAGIPIYTIGLNADGKLNKAPLEDLAKQTGAKSFSTSSANDLPQILSEIFASHLKLKIVPVQSMTGNVITSYSIHYTKLYELTERSSAHAPDRIRFAAP